MMIIGLIIFYIGYRNTGFISRREEVIDRWSILIDNGYGKANDIFNNTEKFIRESKAKA